MISKPHVIIVSKVIYIHFRHIIYFFIKTFIKITKLYIKLFIIWKNIKFLLKVILKFYLTKNDFKLGRTF